MKEMGKMNHAKRDFCKEALDGDVVCNIGQVGKADARALDKLVRSGSLTKWRGYWFPVSGAPFGIGPLKTCYALPEIAAVRQSIGRS